MTITPNFWRWIIKQKICSQVSNELQFIIWSKCNVDLLGYNKDGNNSIKLSDLKGNVSEEDYKTAMKLLVQYNLENNN